MPFIWWQYQSLSNSARVPDGSEPVKRLNVHVISRCNWSVCLHDTDEVDADLVP